MTHPALNDVPVKTELRGNVLCVSIDNPPVNALGVAGRRGLREAIETAEQDPAVTAVLIIGAGRTFVGGADIREFGQTPHPPALPDVRLRSTR